MCGNHNAFIVINGRGHYFSKLAFGWNVQTVGGFIHQEQFGIGGYSECNEDFFLLSKGQF